MDTEKRLTILEDKVDALLNTLNIKDFDNYADIASIRNTEDIHGEGISENDTAVCDVAELSDVNSQAIDDLAELVDELSNKVAEMEG